MNRILTAITAIIIVCAATIWVISIILNSNKLVEDMIFRRFFA